VGMDSARRAIPKPTLLKALKGCWRKDNTYLLRFMTAEEGTMQWGGWPGGGNVTPGRGRVRGVVRRGHVFACSEMLRARYNSILK